MLTVDFIEHIDAPNNVISEIIKLKSEYWNYSKEEHFEWMNKNLLGTDIHFLIRNNDSNLIAYLNMISVSLTFGNGNVTQLIGIGNVCVAKKETNKNLGALLLDAAQFHLKSNSLPSCLFCKKDLVGFYMKHGWKLYKGILHCNNKRIDADFLYRDLDLEKNNSIVINRIF